MEGSAAFVASVTWTGDDAGLKQRWLAATESAEPTIHRPVCRFCRFSRFGRVDLDRLRSLGGAPWPHRSAAPVSRRRESATGGQAAGRVREQA